MGGGNIYRDIIYYIPFELDSQSCLFRRAFKSL